MKRLALLILLMAPAAFGVCKLPIVESYTFNGIPADADSIRYRVYNYYDGTVLYNVAAAMDSFYANLVNVDSAGTYRVVMTVYANSQRLMSTYFVDANCYGGNLWTAVDAIRDSGEYFAQVGAGGGGGCPDSVGNAWTIVAWDSVNNVPVTDATITIKSSVASAIPLAQASSPFTFTKSSGSAVVVVEANGVTFPVRSFTISGTRVDTINGGGLSVIAPSSPDEATVYGTLIGGDGEVAANWDVRFTLEDVKANLADTATGQMVVIKVIETSTNGSGYFTKGLLKTENMLYKSGTQFKHPVWRMVASPSDVKVDPRIDFTFSIPSDSTTLDLGLLIKEGVN